MVHILTFLGRKDGRKKENFRKEFGKQADTGIDTGRKQVEATRFPSRCEESIFYILGAKVERRGELTRFQNQIRSLDRIPTPVTRFPVRHLDLWPPGQVPVTVPFRISFHGFQPPEEKEITFETRCVLWQHGTLYAQLDRFARRLFSSGSTHEIIGRLRYLFEREYSFLFLLLLGSIDFLNSKFEFQLSSQSFA